MKYGLDDATIGRINGVFTSHPTINRVILYGSWAIDTYKENSDIDLSLAGDGIDLKRLHRIETGKGSKRTASHPFPITEADT
jgi:predicted nucleotidyltransferase